jgi:hypothetical protein
MLAKIPQGNPMKSNPGIIVISLILTAFTLACVTWMGEGSSETQSAEEPGLVESPAVPAHPQEAAEEPSCPHVTDRIIELAALGDGNFEEELLNEEYSLVAYRVERENLLDPYYYEDVPADLQDEQQDTETHRRIWMYFLSLIPGDSRGFIAEYTVFTDGLGGTLAAVSQTDSDPQAWALHVDTADISNKHELTYTLVHEFAHLLTLGPNQVVPSIAVFNNPDDNNLYFEEIAGCPNYFPGEGCANPGSYINAFFYEFWEGIHEEWNAINLEVDEDLYYEKLDAFYYKYEDRFVNSYAATSPEEDIAESFTFFVFSPKPAGDSVAREKLLFFYRYPELVQLRAEILENTCAAIR